MKTDWKRLDDAYETCKFLDTLKAEQVVGITNNLGNFYVFYKKE